MEGELGRIRPESSGSREAARQASAEEARYYDSLESRVASIEKHLEFVATREDVQKAFTEIQKVKTWVLGGVIVGGVLLIGWMITLLPGLAKFLSTSS